MLKITTTNKIEIEFEEKTITLKPISFSKYSEMIGLFDRLLEAQVNVNFSIARLLADKKNYETAKQLCSLFRVEGEKEPLNIEIFEDNLTDLCALLFGMSKEPYKDLTDAFWAWLYPNNKNTLDYITKFETLQQEDVIKQLLKEVRTIDISDLFIPPAIATIHKLNWFTDFVGKAEKRAQREAEQERQRIAKIQENSISSSSLSATK